MRVVLTGASGSLGHCIADLLETESAIELFPVAREHWNHLHESVAAARPDVVIHSAACGMRYPRPSYREMVSFNIDATLRLFEAAPDAHFIFISSGLAYSPQGRALTESDPLGSLDSYASTKAAADLLLRSAASACGRRLTVVRPFCFSGPYDGGGRLFPSLLCAAVRGVPFLMSPGCQVRDYCSVADVAAAVQAVVHRRPESSTEVFNIGSGKAITLRDLIGNVCEALHLKVDLRIGARPYSPHEPMHLVADATRAQQALGWSPQTDFAYSIWELAQSAFPGLPVSCPQ